MKNSLKIKATAQRGHVLAVALLLGSAGSMPAHAQQTGPAGPAPQLAMTKAAGAPATETLQTPKVQVFETAPALRQATQDAVAAPKAAGREDALAALKAGTAVRQVAQEEADVPWMLEADTRPWPLAYAELIPLNALYLSLPTPQEARILLPGNAAEASDRTRFTINRYVTDNIGAAAQVRGRQLEAFKTWVDNVERQKRGLPKDPWAAYQFSKEARDALATFKARVAGQTEPTLRKMADDINQAVAQISPVMEATGSYEQKIQWYNLLVQMKEGMAMYQSRTLEADAQILAEIEAFEQANPPAPRPEGKPPARPVPGMLPVTAETPVTASAAQPVQREEAQAPTVREQPSGVTGNVVLLAVAAMVIGFFVLLRKRVAKKGAAGKTPSE